ncbi:MAG: response regulator, partial [Chloroflexi bacterium]
MPTRILIADDHLAVREGLRSLLEPESDFEIIGEAADGNEAAQKALDLKPDLIVLDNSMPGMTGLEVARILRANLPQTKIVFLTLDPGIRDLALATGAVAHVAKDVPPQEIMRVVRAAAGLRPQRATSGNGHAVPSQTKLAELVVAEHLLTTQQVQDVEGAREKRQTLANALLRSGLVPEEKLADVFARASGQRLMSLRPEAASSEARGRTHAKDPIDPTVARQLPRRFCEQRAIVLVELKRAQATLAMADPFDEATANEVRDMLGGVELSVVTATVSDVRDAIQRSQAPAVVPLVAVAQAMHIRRRRAFPLVAAIAAAFLLFATGIGVVLTQGTATDARANLTIFQGAVEIRHGAGPFVAASTNDLLRQGDTVRTSANANAALAFFESSIVVLEPGTEVEVVSLRQIASGRDIDVVMRQTSGMTWHVVSHPLGAGARYAVLTPSSTSTVQGTAFQVAVDARGMTTVTTTDGVVHTQGA